MNESRLENNKENTRQGDAEFQSNEDCNNTV